MKCISCGKDFDNQFDFCPYCGKSAVVTDDVVYQQEAVQQIFVEPTENKVIHSLKSGFFLICCILLLLSCLLYFFPPIPLLMFTKGFPIFTILLTCFSCSAYISARKNKLPEKQIRNTSNLLKAFYIIVNIFCVAIVGAGLLLFLLLLEEDLSIDVFQTLVEGPQMYLSDSMMRKAIVCGAVGIIVSGVIVFIVNQITLKRAHLFVKSIQEHMTNMGATIKFAKTTSYTLIILAIIKVLIGMLSTNVMYFVLPYRALSAITLLILAMWVNKFFAKK